MTLDVRFSREFKTGMLAFSTTQPFPGWLEGFLNPSPCLAMPGPGLGGVGDFCATDVVGAGEGQRHNRLSAGANQVETGETRAIRVLDWTRKVCGLPTSQESNGSESRK